VFFQRLKLKYVETVSNFAYNFSLRRYTVDGSVLKRPDSVPVTPGFKATLSTGAAANKPAVDCVASAEVPAAVSTLYGPDLEAKLQSARAKWLASAATPAAAWTRLTVDPITGEPADGPPREHNADARSALLTSAEVGTTRYCSPRHVMPA
jgi:hypothetical protein